jgi:hypothetical protein
MLADYILSRHYLWHKQHINLCSVINVWSLVYQTLDQMLQQSAVFMKENAQISSQIGML